MSETLGRKLGALAGLLGAIFLFMGNGALLGDSSTEDSAKSLLKTLSDTDTINGGVTMIVIAAGLLLLFSVTLRAILAEAEAAPGRLAQLSLAGAAAGSATLLVGPLFIHSVAWRYDVEASSVTGGVAAIAHATVAMGFFYSALFYGMATLATAAVTLRTGALPKWFGWFALVIGLCMVVGSVGSTYDAAIGFVAGVPMMLFYIVASIVVFMKVQKA